MFEYNPYRINQLDSEQVYRDFQFGLLLDVFMLDERSYRGANSPNRQTRLDADSAFLGSQQTAWLKASRATWKVIESDMPISLVVPDANPDVPKGTHEAWANADNGTPLGRELELREILGFIKREDIKNVVWVTADVHYAQATYAGDVLRSVACVWPREDRSGEPRDDGLAARPRRQVAIRSEARRRSVSVDAAEAGEGRLYRFSERRMRFEAERRDETRRRSSRSSSRPG